MKKILTEGNWKVGGVPKLLYKVMVSKVNDSFFLNEAKPAAIPFANELNLRIKKYKAIIATRETLNSKKKKKNDGTDGTKS